MLLEAIPTCSMTRVGFEVKASKSSSHKNHASFSIMVSLSEALHFTLKLNNKAVAQYHSNDFSQAAKIYHESLLLAHNLLTCPRLQEQSSMPCRASGTTTTTLRQYECFHSSTQSPRSLSKEDGLFVYQSALVLQESPSRGPALHDVLPQASSTKLKVYCSGILFNAAILHHQVSIKTGKSVSMNRAEELYQASLQLVDKLTTANDTVVLIAVAASNNLAQIEFEKGQMMKAKERLRFLNNILHSWEDILYRIFTADEFRGMLSNTVLVNSIDASPAA